MSLFFLPSLIPPERKRLPGPAANFSLLRRPFGVILVAVLTFLLHGTVLFWYFERPVLPPLNAAAPLPIVDIVLSAPSLPAVAQPVSPPKPLPKPKPERKPLKKSKPKQKPQHAKTAVTPEPRHEKSQQQSPVATPVPAPVQAAAASPRQETYVPASSNADYLHNPRPVYPALARRRHWEGLVLLRVFVTADGHCGKVAVSRSSGHEVLDESALDAVKEWRFVPAKRGEIAQASWVTVPIEFELR